MLQEQLHVQGFWTAAGCSDWAQRGAAAVEGQATAESLSKAAALTNQEVYPDRKTSSADHLLKLIDVSASL